MPDLVERLRPEMLERVRWHRAEGHAVVIVSASLGAYLRPLAERLGIDAALAVELVTDADGMLTGEVVGELNTRGPEKVARLRAWADQRYGPATRRRAVGLRRLGRRQGAAGPGRPPHVGRAAGREGLSGAQANRSQERRRAGGARPAAPG